MIFPWIFPPKTSDIFRCPPVAPGGIGGKDVKGGGPGGSGGSPGGPGGSGGL